MNLSKFHRPSTPGEFLVRERLHRLLDAGVRGPLTLVSAPAGYGKSQLVSHWLGLRAEPCAWLTLDDDDRDPRQFLEGVLAAIHSMWPDACPETALLLGAHELPPLEALARPWVNELAAIGARSILVLDDLQRVRGSEAVALVDALLEHPSPVLHLVILTRSDPALDLAGMRGSGTVTEVRARDLRFDRTEIRDFLSRSAGFTPTDELVAHLDRVIEGWPAGLRLAALAAAHQPDPNGFLTLLEGSLPGIRDYLIGQTLAAQSAAAQRWLLRSAVLDEFCAELCNAVCRSEEDEPEAQLDGEAFIQHVRKAGLFVVDLDVNGTWCRYHHAFRDALREQLAAQCSRKEIARLHRLASRWFEASGDVEAAIGQALAAKDVERAARIIERNRVRVLDQDRPFDLARWLKRLPEDTPLRHPGLLLARVWAEFEGYRPQGMANLLERVAELEREEQHPNALVPPAELQFLWGVVHTYRGDAARCLECFERALEGVPETSDSLLRAELELHYGLALHLNGRTADGLRAFDEWLGEFRPAASLRTSRLLAGKAFVHLFAGELAQAARCAELMSGDAGRLADPYVLAWSCYLRGTIALQWYDLEAARELLGHAVRNRFILQPRAAVDACVGLALACQLAGLAGEADEALAVALDFAQGTGDSDKLDVARSGAARLALLRGELEPALRWLRSSCSTPDFASIFCWFEAPCITECRVLVARGSEESLREAVQRLERIARLLAAVHDAWREPDLAALMATALHGLGRAEEAEARLAAGLALGSAGGWMRPFVELGPPMAELLKEQVRLGSQREHAQDVLAVMGARATASRAPALALAEPLTTREEQILELLAKRLRDKEIAQALHVSPQTVKSHLRHVYQKLGVSGRREAVAKGRSLGLVVES